jgi:hypothetical protein
VDAPQTVVGHTLRVFTGDSAVKLEVNEHKHDFARRWFISDDILAHGLSGVNA